MKDDDRKEKAVKDLSLDEALLEVRKDDPSTDPEELDVLASLGTVYDTLRKKQKPTDDQIGDATMKESLFKFKMWKGLSKEWRKLLSDREQCAKILPDNDMDIGFASGVLALLQLISGEQLAEVIAGARGPRK